MQRAALMRLQDKWRKRTAIINRSIATTNIDNNPHLNALELL